MTSFERVYEYTLVEPEAATETAADVLVPVGWPTSGAIAFEKCDMRYREGLDLVLRNVSFTLEGGSKMGVCGRTGAGKSTIMVSLFRIVELAGGCIKIDGVDISTLGLQMLRDKLVIMPQDPVLFSGSVRRNIDPTGMAASDEEVWEVLDAAQLSSFIHTLPGGLDADVSENGDNFSAGQRQCLCMARALLRKPKVLVLDEATASVDAETDTAIQKCINTQLTTCTCLIIAHRLHTIMGSDRILVMDKGSVGEFDTPANLLEKPCYGLLKSLVDETGPASSRYLHKIAKGEADAADAVVMNDGVTDLAH